MKVGPAMNIFSKANSAGLKYMVEQEHRPPTYQTTAWFLEQVDHWFDIMSSRRPVIGTQHTQNRGVPKGHQVPSGHHPTLPWAEDWTNG